MDAVLILITALVFMLINKPDENELLETRDLVMDLEMKLNPEFIENEQAFMKLVNELGV
ncbi:MAG: hypothetical protein LBS29_04930 [Endomicrobium sp.]|jgi:hypothetical protein|nr:hypothetical protein [Endomicrobium sp.]